MGNDKQRTHSGKKLGWYVSGPHERIVKRGKFDLVTQIYFGVNYHYGGGSVPICEVLAIASQGETASEHAIADAQKNAERIVEMKRIVDGPDSDTVICSDWSAENPEPTTAFTVENFKAAMAEQERIAQHEQWVEENGPDGHGW